MLIFNITNPITILLLVASVTLVIFLAQEVKKSYIAAIPLFAFLLLLIVHMVQISTMESDSILINTLYKCLAIDFGFVLVTFFAYLWVDDIEAKANNIKSIDHSLDWFWKEI